jgi:hypothetical protein
MDAYHLSPFNDSGDKPLHKNIYRSSFSWNLTAGYYLSSRESKSTYHLDFDALFSLMRLMADEKDFCLVVLLFDALDTSFHE